MDQELRHPHERHVQAAVIDSDAESVCVHSEGVLTSDEVAQLRELCDLFIDHPETAPRGYAAPVFNAMVLRSRSIAQIASKKVTQM